MGEKILRVSPFALPNLIKQLQIGFHVIWLMKMLNQYQLVNVNRLDFLTEGNFFFHIHFYLSLGKDIPFY